MLLLLAPMGHSAAIDNNLKDFHYERHRPEQTVLYKLVQENFETFAERFQLEMGHPLPDFVLKEFQEYLACGIVAHGFIRLKCEKCPTEYLVAFSCKRRGFCPSCGARRMAESAAHLVDEVLPDLPIRQFVMTFPFPIRPLLAVRPKIMAKCLEITNRGISSFIIKKAGLTKSKAIAGAVTLIQRFGGSCNVNVHFHQLFIDGVYELGHKKIPVRFHQVAPPTVEELSKLTQSIALKIARYLEKNNIIAKDQEDVGIQIPLDETFAHLQAASSCYRFLIGPNKGKKALVLKTLPDQDHSSRTGLVAKYSGFSLHAGVATNKGEKEKLERICRYITRPAISENRLSVNANGQVVYNLKTPYDNGTTQIIMDPLEFMEKLAALVPRPRVHLTRFHGCLAPNYKYRKVIVPVIDTSVEALEQEDPSKKKYIPWAKLLKRVFKIDMEICKNCGAKLNIISAITETKQIRKILDHLKLPSSPPTIYPSRGPPNEFNSHGSFSDDFMQEFPNLE